MKNISGIIYEYLGINTVWIVHESSIAQPHGCLWLFAIAFLQTCPQPWESRKGAWYPLLVHTSPLFLFMPRQKGRGIWCYSINETGLGYHQSYTTVRAIYYCPGILDHYQLLLTYSTWQTIIITLCREHDVLCFNNDDVIMHACVQSVYVLSHFEHLCTSSTTCVSVPN